MVGEDKYNNWGASSAFSARKEFSEPPKKEFNLFGNSSDHRKKQNSHLNNNNNNNTSDLFSNQYTTNIPPLETRTSTPNFDLFSSTHTGSLNSFKSNGAFNLPFNTSSHSSKLFNNKPPSTKLVIDDDDKTNLLGKTHKESKISPFDIPNPIINKQKSPPKPSKPTSKIGQLFNFFRKDVNKAKNKIESAFSYTTPKTLSNPSYKAIDARRIGSMRRLILKTKPIKYHLIDVNKVLNARQKMVVASAISATKLITQDSSDDEMDEIEEVEYKPFAKSAKFEQKEDEEEEQIQKETKPKKSELYKGYWSTPEIDVLSELEDEQLRSINNFIIGRVGHGQIAYDYPIDLTRVKENSELNGTSIMEELFDNTISINNPTILAYKDDNNKPALGFELNVPATITLENIKPAEGKSIDDHINYLKRQIGMEFVKFDPLTSDWTFKVKHFSVWGLVDEKQQDLLNLKRKQDANETDALIEYSKVYENEDLDQELKKQRLNEDSKIVPGGWGLLHPQRDDLLTLKRSLVSNEISGIISQHKENDLTGQVNGITIDSDVEDDEEDFDIADVDEVKINAYEPIITDETAFDVIRNKSSFPTTNNWLLQLELANQYNSAMAPMAASQSRIENLTIDKVDEILFPNFNKNQNKSEVAIEVDNKITSFELSKDHDITSTFKTMLDTANITKRKNQIPKITQPKGFKFSDVTNYFPQNSAITLAEILFDSPDQVSISKFGKWLQNYNKSTVDQLLKENEDDLLQCAFICLCANDIMKAIDYALKSKSQHLSVILSLANLQDEFVQLPAQDQLQTWEESRSIEYIPKPIIKIYQLLANQLEKLTDNLPWNITLGLNIFFGKSKDSLKSLISKFENIFPENDDVSDILRFYAAGFDHDKLANSSLSNLSKWIFAVVLANFSFDDISEKLGSELESTGYWKETIIVYSSILDDTKAEELIRKVVINKIKQIKTLSSSEESYLLNTLQIPESLIYEAIALERQQSGDYWGEINALIKVGFWEKAHDTIVKELGPSITITNSSIDILKLLNILTKFPQNGLIIPTWNKGAGIYQNYFKLQENENDVEIINFLIDNLMLTTFNNSVDQKFALNIISKYVGELALENSKISSSQRNKILELPLDKVNRSFFKQLLTNLD
ncbi:NUP145 [Candida jiufengensis]|uniref:NUP145 n=1 Tax=Candida jiufengensis TaxID=497108 RepID=UPI002225717A|nr:NUP145 [Candida jiufengensis]KAI5954905.1 NUP145 [Candida jiufengensis]